MATKLLTLAAVLAVVLTTARFAMAPIDGIGVLLFALVLGLAAALVVVTVVRRRRRAAPTEANDPVAATPAPIGDEHIPRWRRPSVAAARFATDATAADRAATAASIAPVHPPRVFTEPIDEVAERMWVIYDDVPVLERPDEALGRTQEQLDRGDEVMVLRRDSILVQVKTPTGVIGWVPSMTLTAVETSAIEGDLDPGHWVEPEPAPLAEEAPSLESLLAAIRTERRASLEPASGADKESAASKPRPRRRSKPQSSARPT